MTDPREISILDYTYDLPEEKIALHPLAERDQSKLMIYRDGILKEDKYRNISQYIEAGALLVFNNTKVINARLRFKKPGGSVIEIFCLEPAGLINEYSMIMSQQGSITWKCFIGGAAKWKDGELALSKNGVNLIAEKKGKDGDTYLVHFSWNPAGMTFGEILHQFGDIPLPPYIKRLSEAADLQRYQTIYAEHEGSVAAPTAGLHFTENIFKEFTEKKIDTEYITLHVGAGTFKPVKASAMKAHDMHAEWIDVSIESIKNILTKKRSVVAVGTTSARTIESLYWLGVKAVLNPEIETLQLTQWEIYEAPIADSNVSVEEAYTAVINWLEKRQLKKIFTQTQLLILPGYKFRVLQAIITNFHQPQSTLLLLVAAATNGNWKTLYQYALENDFRFLSYSDGNLIYVQ